MIVWCTVSTARPKSLLAEAARLYYIEGLGQEAIARKLSMTRSNVSRVLRATRDTGIVQVSIRDLSRHDELLEQELQDRFDLSVAAVAAPTPAGGGLGGVAALGAEVVVESIATANIAAISWGTTLQAVVEAISPIDLPNVELVQLVGGLVSFDARATAHDLVRELAQRTGARYRYLNSPAVFDSPDALRHLVAETSVRETLDMARRADVALVGIGSIHSGSSAVLLDLLNLNQAERKDFWGRLPVGDVCGRYYDAEGRPLDIAFLRERILAIELKDLRAIPTVVGVAQGRDKTAAVLGALRAGLVDVLVCDAVLARSVVDQERGATGTS